MAASRTVLEKLRTEIRALELDLDSREDQKKRSDNMSREASRILRVFLSRNLGGHK